jgi:glycosyltransferase involved in cell wall biosynthesis
LVSVIVPNYNHARFLAQRLDTVFAQTFRDFEVIALDDCSSDDSRQVLQDYAAKAPMKLVFNEANSGSPFIQWQRGAIAATGKYIWIAESDDYAAPTLLERLVPILESSPEVGLVYCQSNHVSAEGEIKGSCEVWNQAIHPTRWSADYKNSGVDELARYLIVHNTIPNASAVLCRRAVFLDAVRGAVTRRLTGDWWTWSHMLLQSDIAFVADPLNFFRMHGHSVRATTKVAASCAEEFAFKADVCSRLKVPMSVRSRAFDTAYAKWWLSIRDFRKPVDWNWNRRVCADAWTLYPVGALRMAVQLLRANLMHTLRRQYA